MSTIQGLLGVFEELDTVWYYKSHVWCLEQLGRGGEAGEIIQQAIQKAPHENFRKSEERACRMVCAVQIAFNNRAKTVTALPFYFKAT
jgi:hypothetical protein